MGFIYCNLRVLMAENRLNIQNVKDKTTLSRTTISNLYNNYGAGVQFDTMTQLCDLLNCDVGDLFKYVDINVGYEIISKDNIETSVDIHITDPSEGDGFPYIHELNAVLTLKSLINYQNKEMEFSFYIDYSMNFDEHNNISLLSQYKTNFFDNIKEVNFPVYVVDYLEKELDQFICDWSLEYVDNIDVEDIT
ncbi:helix-turn-helix domain-containing protein [Luteimonas abyssi]|uniref:helix-turn-helix domain-containing protein n=1 Tax=Luteimonas abyssi TaxID=1247514 RepID=UPI0009E6B348|nr:helix-turn-helix transcriptional regulator [Luteimonas abyssi]